MKASEFLALCEDNWEVANCEVQAAMGHTYSEGLYIDSPEEKRRADAVLEREVEDALFKLADEKDLGLTGFRGQEYKDVNGKWTCFIRFQLALRARDGDTIMMVFASNKSWLMAAALVELTTERK